MIPRFRVAKILKMWHDSAGSTTTWPVSAKSSRGFAATGNVIDFRIRLGATPIESIELDARSRDDIPALLRGLQLVWTDLDTRRELLSLLEEHFRPGTDRTVGRPGMEIWRILVLAVLKQGLGCDFDRLQELANQHRTVREMLGHGDDAVDGFRYRRRVIMDNVALLSPELLRGVNELVAGGARGVKKQSLATGWPGGVTPSSRRPTCTGRPT